MARGGLGFALIVAIVGGLTVAGAQATNDLRCHAVGSNPGDFKSDHAKGNDA